MKTQAIALNTTLLKFQPSTNNRNENFLKPLSANASSLADWKTSERRTQRDGIKALVGNLARIAPKTALLAIALLATLAAPSLASAQCSYAWWGGKSTAVVAPGQPVDFGGQINGISTPTYILEQYVQGGNFTLSPFNVSYDQLGGLFTVAPSQWISVPASPIRVFVHGVVPISATSGQTAHVSLALYDLFRNPMCSTTVTIQVVNIPALSTEMNTMSGNNEVDEYYKGMIGLGTAFHVFQLSWPGKWQYADVSLLTGAPDVDLLSTVISQVDAPYNRSEVFYLDSNQNVEELVYDNSSLKTWSHANITSLAGDPPAKAGSPLVSLVNPYANTIQVDYLDSAGHIHQLYSSDRTKWYGGGDLTNGTPGATPAAANSPLVTEINQVANTVEIYYLGTNGHVLELWFDTKLWQWHSSDPTAAAVGAPNAAGGSALVSLSNSIANTVQVAYVGTDQHIHQLWWNGTWHTSDLTSSTGAPNVASYSALATEVNTLAGSVELYYLDTSSKVCELWWNPSSGWHSSDPTLGTKAPNAAPNSPLVSVVNTRTKTVQVHYITGDGHVHELWQGQSWNADDVTIAAGAPNAVP